MIKPGHLLIYKHEDGKQFITVGVDKHSGEWGIIGKPTYMPLTDYPGWIDFLKKRGHKFGNTNLSAAQNASVPVIGIKPGSDYIEAIEGAFWFWRLMQNSDKS